MIWLVISFLSCGMRYTFSRCVDIYMCMISQGISGWLFNLIICRYGEIFTGVGILVIFLGNAYFLLINVSRPPLPGVIGHSLLYTSCECMCVVKNEFKFWK